jgi:hypothetical protein
MVTVFRSHGIRIVIDSNDHEPAHVHAINAEGEAKINLIGPQLVWVVGLKRAAVRRAMSIVEEDQQELLARWEELHG